MHPSLNSTQIDKLDKLQYRAARITTKAMKFTSKQKIFIDLGWELQYNFPKMRGGDQRLFGTFPKIYPFWRCGAFLMHLHYLFHNSEVLKHVLLEILSCDTVLFCQKDEPKSTLIRYASVSSTYSGQSVRWLVGSSYFRISIL